MTTPSTTSEAGLLDAPLTRRMVMTLCAAAGLTGLYGLYSAVLSPLVLPGEVSGPDAIKALPAPPPPPENIRMAKQYLPSQPWAVDAKYQFRTADAFIYANEWEPAESNQAVRFRPFAMIYLQPNRRPDEPPITVVSESAYLRFAKKFDVAEADPGRVIAGALQGNVRISGPDNLAIVGRNFVYSEKAMRMWSGDSVQFAYGLHRGRGQGLQVELISDETATPSESIGVTGVQSIRLLRNVAMDLAFPDRGGGTADALRPAGPDRAGRSDDDTAKKDGKPAEPVEVRVRSTGSFEFDVEANVATFSDNVRVYRPTGPEKYDSLQCDQLTLSFEPKADAEVADGKAAENGGESTDAVATTEGTVRPMPETPREPATPARRRIRDGQREGNFRNLDSRLEFRRARARGKHVVLISEANDLTAHLTDLIYDVQTRVASLTSPEMVRISQGTSEVRSPGVTLQHDPHGRMTSIWCQGPGWLKYRDPETGTLQLAAQWLRQLRKFPEPESGMDIIELEQQALVRQPEQKTGLAAEFIRLWTDPQDLRATRPGEPRDSQADRVKLKRMLALRDVALVSPEMHGRTNRLEVYFEDPPEEPADAEQPATSRARRHRGSPIVHAGSPIAIAGSPPSEGGAGGVARNGDRGHIRPIAEQSQHPASPVQRRHNELIAALRPASHFAVADTEAEPDAAATRTPARPSPRRESHPSGIELPRREPVTLPGADDAAPTTDAKQPEAAEKSDALGTLPGDGPIEVYSDIIRVRAVQGQSQRESRMEEVWTEGNVEVTQEHIDEEQPLVITGDKLHLENHSETDQVIHVSGVPAHIYDRGMHIEGRNVHLDRIRNKAWVDGAGLLQLPVKSGLNGEKLDAEQLLDVWWKEKMTFNGEYARFFGDVRSVLNDSKMHCQAMEVRLTDRISFTAREQDRKVEVHTVDCRDGVKFDSTVYELNKLSEVRRGHVARFTLDQLTGRTEAYGPGHIIFWRRGNGRRAGLGPMVPGTAARATPPKETADGAPSGKTQPVAGAAKPKDGKDPKDAKPKDAAGDPNQWEYTRVDFVGKSDGNIQQRFTTFEERVNVVYGPVERPLATIDPDALPRDGGWMRCDKLRLQQHAPPGGPLKAVAAKDRESKEGRAKEGSPKEGQPKEGPKPQGHIDLLGTGNAELEGRTFHGQADEISYDESKGLYILRSLGNRKAMMTRQVKVGGEYSTVEAQSMKFIPSERRLTLDRATAVDASQ